MESECPFWQQQGVCKSSACHIKAITDLEEIPYYWRTLMESAKRERESLLKKSNEEPFNIDLGDEYVSSYQLEDSIKNVS
jgi:hypothetical protein